MINYIIVNESNCDDLPPDMEVLVKEYLSESPLFENMTFCPIAMRMNMEYKAKDPYSVLAMFYVDGVVAGFYSGSVSSTFTREAVGYENMFYISSKYRRSRLPYKMAEHMKNNLLQLGAKQIYTSSTAGFGSRGYERLMTRFGFKAIEGNFLYYEQDI